MANALTNLANSLFNSRQNDADQQARTANARMLGTGLASNAASGLLMREYQTKAALAQANGEDFPSFEEWVKTRQ